MSEIPPTGGRGVRAPDEPSPTPRLSDDAERILRRRGRFIERHVTELIGRLNITGEHAAIRRENEVVLDAFRKTATERYGPSIADRSVRILEPPATRRGARIDRGAVAAGFRYALSSSDEIRGRPEVRAFLQGGEAFDELSRGFNPPGEDAVGSYERMLVDAVAGLRAAAGARRVAGLAKTAARECFEKTVRRADAVKLDYRQLAAEFIGNPEPRRRLGCFSARGISPATPFVRFAKTDPGGELLTSSRVAPVIPLHDKVHLSVARQDVARAWEALRPFLLSEDNPFLRWKMIVLEHEERALSKRLEHLAEQERTGTDRRVVQRKRFVKVARSQRVTEGAQFTLHAYANLGDLTYKSNGADFRHFLTQLDRELLAQGVRRGRIPHSDVRIGNLEFTSYRNRTVSTRGSALGEAPLTEQMLEDLKTMPFYKAISPKQS